MRPYRGCRWLHSSWSTVNNAETGSVDKPFPYLIRNVRYEKVREGGVVTSQAMLVAIGIGFDSAGEEL
jgi:transposase-like protein